MRLMCVSVANETDVTPKPRIAVLGEQIGDVGDDPPVIDLAENGRRFAHQHGAGAEGLQHKPQSGEFVERRRQRVHSRRVEIDDDRDQQQLSRHAVFGALTLEFLIDETFMRRMLIDDHQPVMRLRNDVGFMQLRAGGAKRRRVGRRRVKRFCF